MREQWTQVRVSGSPWLLSPATIYHFVDDTDYSRTDFWKIPFYFANVNPLKKAQEVSFVRGADESGGS